MRYIYFGLLSIVAAGLIAGCSGASRPGSLPQTQTASAPVPITATPGPGVHGPLATSSLTLSMPVYATPAPAKHGKSAKSLQPSSVRTKQGQPPEGAIPSVVFTVNGTAVSTVNLTQGKNSAYFVTIPLPVGTDHLVADLWDQHDGTGTKIATGVTDTTIVVGAVNTVNLSLVPIVAQVCPIVQTSNVLYGVAGSSTAFVAAFDPDGTPFAPSTLPSSVTFSSTGSSGIAFSPASITDPTTPVTVSWLASSNGTAALNSTMPCTFASTITFGGPYAYVAGQGFISVFDQHLSSGFTNSGSGIVTTLPGPMQPGAIVFDAATSPKKVFAADFANNLIIAYDAQTNTRLVPDVVTLGRPWGLSLSTDGHTLYVGESGSSDRVEMFDVSGASITSVGSATGNALLDGSFINGVTTYASGGNDITAVGSRYPNQSASTSPSIATIANRTPGYQGVIPASAPPLAAPGYATAFSSSGPSANGSLLVRENGSRGLEWIDLGSNFLGASTGTAVPDQYVPGPNAIAVGATGANAYVVGGANSLYHFSWQSTNWSLVSCSGTEGGGCAPSGASQPAGVAISSDHNTLYTLNQGDGLISVFDLTCSPGDPKWEYIIPTFPSPFSIAIGDGGLPGPGAQPC